MFFVSIIFFIIPFGLSQNVFVKCERKITKNNFLGTLFVLTIVSVGVESGFESWKHIRLQLSCQKVQANPIPEKERYMCNCDLQYICSHFTKLKKY